MAKKKITYATPNDGKHYYENYKFGAINVGAYEEDVDETHRSEYEQINSQISAAQRQYEEYVKELENQAMGQTNTNPLSVFDPAKQFGPSYDQTHLSRQPQVVQDAITQRQNENKLKELEGIKTGTIKSEAVRKAEGYSRMDPKAYNAAKEWNEAQRSGSLDRIDAAEKNLRSVVGNNEEAYNNALTAAGELYQYGVDTRRDTNLMNDAQTYKYMDLKLKTLDKNQQEAIKLIQDGQSLNFVRSNQNANAKGQTMINQGRQMLRESGMSDADIDKYVEYATRLQNRQSTEDYQNRWNLGVGSDQTYDSNGLKATGKMLSNSAYALGAFIPGGIGAMQGIAKETLNTFSNNRWFRDADNLGVRDKYANSNLLMNASDYAQGQVLNRVIGDKRQLAQGAYQTVMSTLEAAEVAALSAVGVPESVTLLPYFGSSYNSEYNAARQRGETPQQAQLSGLASGTAEVLTEKVSLDNLLGDLVAAKNRSWPEIIKAAFGQAGFEASEEMASEVLNRITDYAIAGGEGKSQYETDVQEAMASGMTEEEARKSVEKDWWAGFFKAGLSGAASGLLLGLGGGAVSKIAGAQGIKKENRDIEKIHGEESDYAKNPYQLRADMLEEGEYKDRMQQLADKSSVKGNQLNIVDRAKAADIMIDANAEGKYNQYANEILYGESKVVDQQKAEETIAKAAVEGDIQAIAKTYSDMKMATDESIRNAADEIVDAYKTAAMAKGNITEEQWNNALDKNNAIAPGAARRAMRLAGKTGIYTFDEVKEKYKLMTQGFTDEQLKTMYEAGQKQARREDRGQFIRTIKGSEKAGTIEGLEILDEAGIDTTEIELTAKLFGINYVIMNSMDSDDVKASYDPSTNTITMTQGASLGKVHELLGEFMQVYNKEGHDALTKDLMAVCQGMGNNDFQKWLYNYQEKYKKVEGSKTTNEAMKEMTNDLFALVLSTDEGQKAWLDYLNKTYEKKVAEGKIGAIKNFLEKLKQSIKDLFSGNGQLSPFQKEAYNAVGDELVQRIDNIINEFDKAVKTYQQGGDITVDKVFHKEVNDEGEVTFAGDVEYNIQNQIGVTKGADGVNKYTVYFYEDGANGMESGKERLAKFLKESGLTNKDQQDIIDGITMGYEVAKMMMENEELESFGNWQKMGLSVDDTGKPLLTVYKNDGRPIRSVVVNNGEYPLNIDFTQVCKKRIALNNVLNKLVADVDLNISVLTESDIAAINDLIKKHDFEIACGLCFVDSKRYRVGSWADTFVNGEIDEKTGKRKKLGWNGLIKSMLPKGVSADYFKLTDGSPVTPTGTLLSEISDEQLNFETIDKIIKPYLKENGSIGQAIIDGKKSNPTEEVRMAYTLKTKPETRLLLDNNDIIASEGLDTLRETNYDVYALLNAHGGTSKPKLSHGFTAYGNDILESSKWGSKNDFNKENAYAVGGVRVQSFSDYVANMFFDYMQMFADMSARELPSHAYTKEIVYAKLFGMTGQRINMSVIFKGAELNAEQKARYDKLTLNSKGNPRTDARKRLLADPEFSELMKHAGLNSKGEYIFEDESIDFEEAKKLQRDSRYQRTGIIGVGLSDEHIYKMLDDDDFPMVIPYHSSGVSQIIKNARNLGLYTDYTDVQNTRDKNGKKLENGDGFNWYDYLKSDINPNGLEAKEVAEKYLEHCAKNGYLPKFDQFAWHPNYYKLLIDFRAYDNDGNFMPQGSVTMTFPERAEFEKLISDSLVEQQETETRMEQELSGEAKTLYYEVKKMLTEKGTIVPKVTKHALNIDSQGRKLTEGQQEYFKDSKAVDEDGNLMVLYHGSSKEFYTFDRKRIGENYNGSSQWGDGFYFAGSKEGALGWTDGTRVHEVYINMKNPLNVEGSVPKEMLKEVELISQDEYDALSDKRKEIIGTLEEVNNRTLSRIKTVGDLITHLIGNEKKVSEMFEKYGYDGIIDRRSETKGKAHASDYFQYVVFNPNQIKSIFNTNPTTSADVRYSLNVDLASEFVDIAAEFDTYNAWDEAVGFSDLGQEIDKLADDISKGDTSYIVNTLKTILDDEDYEDVHPKAQKLLDKIEKNIVKYSINVDDKGRKLSEGQKKKFFGSEAVDEDGNLLTVYHGSVREFYEFDRSFANVEGNMGKGFYFTNDENDVDRNYANRNGADFTAKVEREAELLEDSEEFMEEHPDVEHDDIVEYLKDKYATAAEPITMECYLDIKNPVYVGNYNGHKNTMLLTDDDFDIDINEENYDDENDYWVERDMAISEKIEDIVDYITRNLDLFDYARDEENIRQVIYEAATEGGATMEQLQDMLEDKFIYDDNYDMANTEVARLVAEALGYDGIIDNTVSKKFRNMGLREDTVHFIVFDSSQAKFVTNENPTGAKDVRHSLDIDDTLSFLWEDHSDTASILEEGMEALKNQKVDVQKLRGLAIKLRNEFGSSYDVRTLEENLEKVFAYLQTEKHVNYNDVVSILNEVAIPVIEQATDLVGEEEYRAFVNAFKGYSIKLTENQKKEVISLYGSYGEFKNAMMPIRFSDKATTTLDQLWGEISDQLSWAGLDWDVTERDMPIVLADKLADMRPVAKNAYEEYGGNIEDVAKDFAMRVIEEYVGGEVGAKMKAKNNAYKQQLRADFNDRLKKARESVRTQGQEKVRAYKKALDENAKWQKLLTERDLKDKAADKQAKADEKIAQKKKDLEYSARWKEAELNTKYDKMKGALEDKYAEKQAQLLARNKEKISQARERQAQREEQKKIQRMSSKITSWIEHPSEEHHVPKAMRLPLLDFLSAFDFIEPVIKADKNGFYAKVYNGNAVYGEPQYEEVRGATKDEVRYKVMELLESGLGSRAQQSWLQKMESIRSLFGKAKALDEDSNAAYNNIIQMIDPELGQELDDVISANAKNVDINNMSSSDLKVISRVLKNLMHAINVGNKAITQNATIEGWAGDTIENAKKVRTKNHTAIFNKLSKNFSIDLATPDTFFSMMGKSGDAIMKSLSDGFDRKVTVIKASQEFMDNALKDFSDKELASLTGDNAKAIPFKYGNQQISLTKAQIMSLYVLNKRNQAVLHFDGGLEADTIKVKEKGKIVRVELTQNKPAFLTRDQIVDITNMLSDKEKALADAMQQFLANDCAKWGNKASMLMYDYEKFTDPNYFPISTDKTTNRTENTDRTNALNGIERMGMTKDVTRFASNPLIIKDIFDVFVDHTSQMSAYYGYAPAIKDANRWYNFKFTDDIGDGFKRQNPVKRAVNTNVFRTDNAGNAYYEKLIRDINGNEITGEVSTLADTLIGLYKGQSIAGNLRVVIQQPTAIVRAANVIDWKYLAKGIEALKPGSHSMERIKEVCPLAWWKSQGYYETSMGKPIRDIITGQSSVKDKVLEYSMWLAGKADDITWSVIYTAVEKEQRDLNRGKNVSKEEFRKQVNERFDKIINETQVVDSVLQKSQMMRGGKFNKLQTAFMAEPIKSYNMLMKAAMLDYKDMMNGSKTLKRTGKAMAVLMVTDIVNASAQAFVDALRHKDDDDGYWETWFKYFKTNALDNINPFQKIPVVKDVWTRLVSAIGGGQEFSSDMQSQALDSVFNVISDIRSRIEGKNTKTGYGSYMVYAKAFSVLSGLPLYNVSRDAVAIYNVVPFWGDLRTKALTGTDYKKDVKEAVDREDDERIVEQVTDSIENNIPISSIRSYLQSTYKDEYYNAFVAEDETALEDLAEKISRGYAMTGMSDEEIDDMLNEWTEEAVTYKDLDKAIEEGSDIFGALHPLLKEKKEEDIVKHIMNKYGSSVEYERDHDTDSEWESNVETALSLIDGTYTYDSVKEDLDAKAQEKADKAALKEERNEIKTSLWDAVETSDGNSARQAILDMVDSGMEASSVKDAISDKYHKEWKEAKTQAEKDNAKRKWINATTLANKTLKLNNAKDPATAWAAWEKKQ